MDFIEFDDPVALPQEKEIQEKVEIPEKEVNINPAEAQNSLTPFERVDEAEGKSSFDFLELDKSIQRKASLPESSGILLCPNCGASNPSGADFCYDCQGELVTFRQVEIDTKPVKVVLKFGNTKKYKICDVCGAHNEADSDFCRDCASILAN
ncbi:MAG: zinc ribbon domain-containing protein [Firmicutes bacterium]|nr:zinc ribbon domain-containing protein [Bacillota bacterium]